MIKIAIFTRKGGVGKTTTTINIAGCLDIAFKKDVLIADCDPQCNTTTCLTIGELEEPKHTIEEIFSDDNTQIRHHVLLQNKKGDGLVDTRMTLLPATRSLDDVETRDMFALKKCLEMYEKDYDYCLMDCPPDLSEMTLNALCAADYLIIPTFSGRDSVNGYGMVVDEVNRMKENGFNENLKILGIFLNAVDKRRALENYYVSLWKKEIGSNVFISQIRDSADIVNSYEFGKPIHYFKPKSRVALDYEDLVSELIQKTKFKKSRKG